jgi:FkbM family methyltransferase
LITIKPNEQYYDNVTYSEKIKGSINFGLGLIRQFFVYRKSYRNYFSIIINVIKKKSNIQCVLKNGEKIVLETFQLINFVAEIQGNPEFQLDLENDIVMFKTPKSISKEEKNIKIYGGITNGDILGMFVAQEYAKFPVENKTIIDIGANIADSAIYFALRGARKVIGFEPFSRNFQMAQKNIIQNKLEKIITVYQAGCSDQDSTINIDSHNTSTASSKLEEKKGITIPLITLKKIISKYNVLPDSILKIDCEGDEYKIIMNTDKKILRTFQFILIEYHFGYIAMKKYLEDCGFNVQAETPVMTGHIGIFLQFFKKSRSKNNELKKLVGTGLMFAKRID